MHHMGELRLTGSLEGELQPSTHVLDPAVSSCVQTWAMLAATSSMQSCGPTASVTSGKSRAARSISQRVAARPDRV